MIKRLLILVLITSLVYIQGCRKESLDGLNSLVSIEDEPSGINCLQGGVKISSGLDLNGNNILDSMEVSNTQYICNGLDVNSDKQIIIPFIGLNKPSTTLATGTVTSSMQLMDFNIANYPGADSIVFGGFPITTDATVKCAVELYDLTNGTIINNTSITSYATTPYWMTTANNFIGDLPSETIDLGISIRSGRGGVEVQMSDPTLIIYRH